MQKPLLLVPIAGHGSRFRDQGVTTPKQQLKLATGRSSLRESLLSVELSSFDVHFVLRKSQYFEEGFEGFLEALGLESYSFTLIDGSTRGSTETCLLGLEGIPERELFIFTVDVSFRPILQPSAFGDEAEGGVLSFKANSNNYCSARLEGQQVLETAEKDVISNDALVGVYYFKSSETFKRLARKMIEEDLTTNGEFYIAPLYNLLISELGSRDVLANRVTEMHLFGTPQEMDFFDNISSKSLKGNVRLGLASDHSGFEWKEAMSDLLVRRGVDFVDFGTHSEKDTDYNKFIRSAVTSLVHGEVDYIFASCRSGNGVNILGNSFPEIIGALVYDSKSGEMAVRHNGANFFSFPQSLWNKSNVDGLNSCLDAILTSRFEGGRHQGRMAQTRLQKIGK